MAPFGADDAVVMRRCTTRMCGVVPGLSVLVTFGFITIASSSSPSNGVYSSERSALIDSFALTIRNVTATGGHFLAPERNLRRGRCIPQLLFTLAPKTLSDYDTCVKRLFAATDMRTVGASTEISAKCWCGTGMKKLIESNECCSDPNFQAMCMINCDDDCKSQKARECLDECPAICFEDDYAPDSCKCRKNNCMEHTLCITEQGRNRTLNGTQDRICHDTDFDNSDEMKAYSTCVQGNPDRKKRNRHNTRSRCVCTANLQKAANRSVCCGASWAVGICATENDCAIIAESSCSSVAAQKCFTDCRSACGSVRSDMLSKACTDLCFESTGECTKYKTCPPLEPLEPFEPLPWEYICDGGSGAKPDNNGCCVISDETGQSFMGCPLLCDERRHYMRSHGPECLCYGCPSTETDIVYKMNETVLQRQRIWESGMMTLIDLVDVAGLDESTPLMKEMMERRNEELNRMRDDHIGNYGAEFETEFKQINAYWKRVIYEVAVQTRQCETDRATEKDVNSTACNNATLTGNAAVSASEERLRTRKEEDAEDDDFPMVPIIILVAVIVFVAVAIGVFMGIRCTKKEPSGRVKAVETCKPLAVDPIEGDPNVVMGRPIENNGVDATTGAPVTPHQPKKAELAD